ncbi:MULTISPECIES: ABC transporter substrate-binding protein [Mycetocola]|nr:MULTISPECIES: ABC transporter substrate-binding protein [Mycetocola]
MRRSLTATLALSVAATLLLAGCSAGAAGGSADHTLTIGQVAEPEKAPDPIMDGSLAGYNYYYNEFDQLTQLSADGELTPRLATKWTPNADFTTWTFTIRTDAKFSNGDPVTAEDVAYTYNKILASPDSDNLGYMETLKAVRATAKDTVEFDLNAPFSPWPSITTAISIVPEKVYEKLGSDGFAKAPVGSGPFKFESYTRGVNYTMVANPDYWGKAPETKKVVFQTVGDEDARLNGVISGSLDIALISPNQATGFNAPGASVKSRTGNGSVFLGINSTAGVLADAKVRQAISLAIDEKSLVSKVLSGSGTANDQVIAPSVAGYVKDAATHEFDPEKAKSLLAEAGYKGEKITFQYATSGRIPLSSNVAQAIQGYLKAVGLNIELAGTDQATLSSIIYSTVNAAGIYLNTWAPSTLDGDMPVTNLFAGGQNDYAKDAAAKDLVLKQRTVSGDERTAVFAELHKLNVEQAHIIGLYTPNTDYAVRDGITWKPRADGEFVIADITYAK